MGARKRKLKASEAKPALAALVFGTAAIFDVLEEITEKNASPLVACKRAYKRSKKRIAAVSEALLRVESEEDP